jgi:hypothetical protein
MPNETFFLVCLTVGLVMLVLNRPSPVPPRLPHAVAHIASASPGPGLMITRHNPTCPPNAAACAAIASPGPGLMLTRHNPTRTPRAAARAVLASPDWPDQT